MTALVRFKNSMLLAFLVGLCVHLPAMAQDASPRLLAAQFLLIEASDYQQLEQTFIELKQAGVNTIILRVFQNMGDRPHKLAKGTSQIGVYFNTKRAPVIDNLLTPVSELAHNHGLKIFALMTTLHCDWKISEAPELQGSGYNLGSKTLYNIMRLDPFKRQVRYYLGDLYRDLAACDIDGIMFQDDLVLRNTEGFSLDAHKAFKQEVGFPLVPGELFKGTWKRKGKYVASGYSDKFWQWSKFKNKSLLGLAKNLMANARSVKPNLKFAVNLYYETVTEPKNALAWLSQDLKAALEYNFDYYALMAYHRQMTKEMGLTPKNRLKVLTDMTQKMKETVGDNSKIWMKFQIKDWETGQQIPVEELEQILQIITKIEGASLAYVPHAGQPPLKFIKKYYTSQGLD